MTWDRDPNPPEHRCRGETSLCDACCERYCDDCAADRRGPADCCYSCQQRGVRECASCSVLIDPDDVGRAVVALGLCATCALAEA